MKNKIYLALGGLAVLAAGCSGTRDEEKIVSQSYIHKYGYAVSKQEWESENYPGQVITTLSDGVTVTATYEDGLLHGPCTHTYPHTQTVESYILYNKGSLAKEIYYDVNGLPVKEIVHSSPTRHTITLWYKNGSPLSIEEYFHQELTEGQYFTLNNEVESRVIKGNGTRIARDPQGILKAKDEIHTGLLTRRETFHSNGIPESNATYVHGKLHGVKKSFTASGEPQSIEEWSNGELNGNVTYFKNGAKFIECTYVDGLKNGYEIHYNNDVVSQKTLWKNDKRHGPSSFYIDGNTHTAWYYDNRQVTHKEYTDLSRIDERIVSMSEEFEPR